ncbi:MAG: metallophosphoesterase [Blastocatellia bacterium]|nr:metallophosphoesterase [Blastocatellia bacterium]
MQPAELYRVLLFVSVIAAVYVLAASVAIRSLLHRLGYVKLPSSKRARFSRRMVLVLAALGIVCISYGYFIEPYWPSVTRVSIRSSKLSAGSRPIRIVHISDLHCDPEPRLEARLPDIIAAEEPDIIVFTGDAINSPAAAPAFKELLRRLVNVAPTFTVRGNWDTAFWRNIDLTEGTGAKELDGQTAVIEIDSLPVRIAGLPAGEEREIAKLLDGLPPDDFTVFLYHYPDEIEAVARHGVDLYCAGHTHGGQIALPFYGALVTFSRFGKKYEAGLYRVQDTWLYVNRGIGMEGGDAPRVRFCARPEVTVIEVVPAS